ncbi:NAD-dependent epimerase/dehydratase family protein [Candidatus Bathyarchaeota archaeon]|nr:NAD-dependent epimerase/dehydratase family protein [Candidatus Bathyarchaeota archaeon]
MGSHLSEKLVDRGDSITLFDLTFDSNTQDLSCEKIRGDVRDYEAVRKAVDGTDSVLNFAAVSRVVWGQKDPYNCWMTNVSGTINVLEACRKVENKPTLFYASSREVYGEPLYQPVDEGHPKNPRSVYGMSKFCAEKACLAYSRSFGLEGSINEVIFRFSNVYGSERDLLDRVIPKFMLEALRGEDITLYGGEQILDFTFIDDTISGILNAYDASLDADQERAREIFGEDFHFVTGKGTSVIDLAKMIIDLVDSPSRIIPISSYVFEVQKFIGDPKKSQNMLGFKSKIKLEDGLKILKERLAPKIN